MDLKELLEQYDIQNKDSEYQEANNIYGDEGFYCCCSRVLILVIGIVGAFAFIGCFASMCCQSCGK